MTYGAKPEGEQCGQPYGAKPKKILGLGGSSLDDRLLALALGW